MGPMPAPNHDQPSNSHNGFLRERLVVLGRFLCLFSLFTIVLFRIVSVFVPSMRQPSWPFDVYSLQILTVAGVFGLTWAIARRKCASVASLLFVDAASTMVVGTAIGAMILHVPKADGTAAWMVLGLTLVLTARAAMLPSTKKRTFWLGLAASFPTPVFSYLALAFCEKTPDAMVTVQATATTATMLFLSVLVQTATTKVIYGLRQEVRAAKQLGQYTLEMKIGEGGMGAVYRARHAMLRRPTAVKLLLPGRGRTSDLARFEREVQKTSELTHPNTVTVFDYGRTPDGVFYYAMEYLDGASLGQIVEASGPQPPERVVHILRQVAGALVEAHAASLIHRDIKPANIILCERGKQLDVAKVVDFGLVKEVGASGGSDLTHAETLAGTPLFISPEALTDPDKVDGRSDLYALGAVGYYLLTGETPFDGNTVVEVCGHHLHTQPAPPSTRLGVPLPERLETILLACLEKAPANRPQDASALLARLDRTGLAEEWTQDRAKEWWDEHGDRVRELRESQVKSASGRTIAIDLERAARTE